MVKSGVEITVTTDRSRYRPGDQVLARIVVKNVGVGHYFPTYVTPRVVVRASLIETSGAVLRDTEQEYVIAREVSLDLSREISDTRIPPGERATFSYRRTLPGQGLALRITVTVQPDHFYTGFFKSLLASAAGGGAPHLHEALDATRRSAFDIFSKDLPLT
jgi:hypothetical protein